MGLIPRSVLRFSFFGGQRFVVAMARVNGRMDTTRFPPGKCLGACPEDDDFLTIESDAYSKKSRHP